MSSKKRNVVQKVSEAQIIHKEWVLYKGQESLAQWQTHKGKIAVLINKVFVGFVKENKSFDFYLKLV